VARDKKAKDLAQRIDATYYRRPHWLRRTRFLLSATGALFGTLWVASALESGHHRLFSNGALGASHALFEQECSRCHVERFGPVRDGACIECHVVGAHLPVGRPGEPACASCHKEHGGRGRLDVVADGHCNLCHEDHAGIRDLKDHDDFRPRPYDQFLNFSHVQHLAPSLLEGPIDCGGCHVPEGAGFRPIAFAEHCARCHTERLDADVGDETVPHGVEPRPLRDWIAALYLRRIGKDPALAQGTPPDPLAIPDWAKAIDARTEASLKALMQPGRGCLLCHVATEGRIEPPRVPLRWLGRARFDHKTHRFDSCGRCHNMSLNAKSSDLTLPGIATCRECHREQGARTTCVTCHPYHPTGDMDAWR